VPHFAEWSYLSNGTTQLALEKMSLKFDKVVKKRKTTLKNVEESSVSNIKKSSNQPKKSLKASLDNKENGPSELVCFYHSLKLWNFKIHINFIIGFAWCSYGWFIW